MNVAEIFKIVAANGVFAVLFFLLLMYELRDSRAREKKYQETVSTLADRLSVVNDIKEEFERLTVISPAAAVHKESPPQKFKES